MTNPANELPFKLSSQEQLATLLGIQACLVNGIPMTTSLLSSKVFVTMIVNAFAGRM